MGRDAVYKEQNTAGYFDVANLCRNKKTNKKKQHQPNA